MPRGALGHEGALLDMADRFDDPAFFERPPRFSADVNPAHAAEVAENFGRLDDAFVWRTIAAENGDTEAMRELIEGSDRSNPLRCWTWFYLAELLGTDLTKDEYRAISEDGSDYDDDVGGPAFVGGRGGVELPPVDEETKAKARIAANALYHAIDGRVEA